MNINHQNNYTPNFLSAKDLHLRYILKHNSQYLPESILKEVTRYCKQDKASLPDLLTVHSDVYKRLYKATTLDQVKSYPEFKNVIDITTMRGSRSKIIKAIQKIMPLEQFTLQYLKDLYTPITMDNLAKKYGVSGRSILNWLNNKLNIQKLTSSYVNLLRMSDPKENERIADCTRASLKKYPEVYKKRLVKAAEAHRTPEYRSKKSREMKEFYKRKPEAAEKTAMISQETWNRCPEIKQALKEFTKTKENSCVQIVLIKRSRKEKLNEIEKRILKGYYKEFWDSHPQMKIIYQEVRKQVIKDLFS